MIKAWYTLRTQPEYLPTEQLLAKKLDQPSLTDFASKAHNEESASYLKPTQSSGGHADFDQAVSSSEHHKPKNMAEGYEDKLVYKTPNSTFMVKPYNSRVNNGLGGFSTSATKRMYEAAGLHNNIEDVKHHTLNTSIGEMPVMVHKFADNVESFNHSHKIDPLIANKINIMDYLTGNTDRHIDNVMVNKQKDQKGYNNPIAIDHSFAFNYDHNTKSNKDFLEGSTLGGFSDHIDEDQNHAKNLASWWLNSAPKVKSSLIDEANGIKHDDWKNHILSSYKARHEAMTNWANDTLAGHEPFFSDITANQPKNKSNHLYVDAKPEQALDHIAKSLHGKTHNPWDISEAVGSATGKEEFNDIPKDKLLEILSNFPHNDNGTQSKLHITKALMEDNGKKTDYHKHLDKLKLRDILAHDDKMPNGAKHLTPFMSHKVRKFLGDIIS